MKFLQSSLTSRNTRLIWHCLCTNHWASRRSWSDPKGRDIMQVRSSSQHRQQGSEGPGRHAVVVGGSIGGMLTARVLSEHFDRITLIERDHLPEGTANRPGVPQARHLHFFLKRGLMVVEELFPGVKPDLLAAGSHLLDQGKDFRILYRSGWSPNV